MSSTENFDPSRISSHPAELYGIKASLNPHDGFAALVGDDWETVRWYATASERDRVLETIATRHEFSRIGDAPAVNYVPVQRTASGGQ